MIEVLKQDRPKIKRMAELVLRELGDEAESLEQIQEYEHKAQLKGKLEGELESKRETARKMKADGLEDAVISKYTGLSKKEILSL
ncbi:MAG: hypothetical protein CVV27_16990 [Candidatus Melainabacteria bacterium HGW-Melainabacteria-1]|nr:MAG: hypothetical protein CVV27_16990 [Candidatus Melainabacteria bacterium HGW-Melainabacteria-1]